MYMYFIYLWQQVGFAILCVYVMPRRLVIRLFCTIIIIIIVNYNFHHYGITHGISVKISATLLPKCK